MFDTRQLLKGEYIFGMARYTKCSLSISINSIKDVENAPGNFFPQPFDRAASAFLTRQAKAKVATKSNA